MGGRRGIWVVDPIDGTQPFVSDLTSWCVSIGFVNAGVIEMGFLAAPARDEVFVGPARPWRHAQRPAHPRQRQHAT